jgi:HIV-1 Vpr-binding protein
VFSRFRPVRTLRALDAMPVTCATWAGSTSVLGGSADGGLHLWDATTGVCSLVHPSGHSGAGGVAMLDAAASGARHLIASSSRSEVRLWNAAGLDAGPMGCFDGVRGGRLSASAARLAAACTPLRAACVFDTDTRKLLYTLRDGDGAGGRASTWADIAWSSDERCLLWGGALWDARAERPLVHRFDQVSEAAGASVFHPNGLAAVLATEMWDLRTLRLIRSMPQLAGTDVRFGCSGTVGYSWLRSAAREDARAARHPLRTAFATFDSATFDWAEIGTHDVERTILGMSLEASDRMVAVVERGDGTDVSADACVRVYEVGRARPGDADASDLDDDGSSSGSALEASDDEAAEAAAEEEGLEALEAESEENDAAASADLASDDSDASGDAGQARRPRRRQRQEDYLPFLMDMMNGAGAASDDSGASDGSVLLSGLSDDEMSSSDGVSVGADGEDEGEDESSDEDEEGSSEDEEEDEEEE